MRKILLLILILFPVRLSAQTTSVSGFDINFLRPSRDGSGILLTAGSSTLKWREFGLGADLRWSQGLLAAINTTTGNRVRVVDRLIVSDLNLALGLFRPLSLGIGLPVVIRGQEINLTDESSFSFTGIGDLDTELKLSLLPDRKRSVGVGLIETVSLPTGSPGRFTGYGHVSSWSRLVIDKALGPVYLAANVGYRLLQSKTVLAIPVGNELTYSAGLSIRLGKGWELFGEAGGYLVPSNSTAANRPLIGWGGIRKNFGRGRLHAAGGKGITSGSGSSEWTAAAGGGFRKLEWKKGKEKQRTLVGAETIQFAFEKDQFLAKWNLSLDRIVQMFLKSPSANIVVSAGHADSEGDEAFNLSLSQRRAERVAHYLRERGIPEEKIAIEAYGELQPIADNRTFEGKARNRRVEIRIYN